MSSVKWWRVVDPLNPLSGCDVKIDELSIDRSGMHVVRALRRLDLLVGDRTYQLVNPGDDPSGIGIAVDKAHLQPSPVQDDVVEIEYDRPFGKCLSEDVIGAPSFAYDGAELRVAKYENAIQVAYGEREGELYATCTLRGDDRDERFKDLLDMYKSEDFEYYSFIAKMKQEDR